MKVSILHPTRSRPQKSMHTITEWLRLAGSGVDIEIIVSIDDDDPHAHAYESHYAGILIKNKNRSAVDAINKAAEKCTGDLIVVVSDDFACPKGWNLTLERLMKGRQNWLLKTFDGMQKWVVTLPIMDRYYYERFGYVYHPSYLHMFCDTELSHVADVTRRLLIRNDINFIHNHYSVMKQAKDAVSLRADQTWNHGKKIYLDRLVKKRFDLPEEVDVMAFCSEGLAHKEWLRKHGVLPGMV